MKEIFVLVVILLYGNGETSITADEVFVCPPESEVRLYMEEQKRSGVFQEWAAYCLPISFNNKKETEL
jgi:hypothetical protein|tara:strand:+ start:534 stop:737 length:204 start_codon:yes stop_codon:yes gene_type:complete